MWPCACMLCTHGKKCRCSGKTWKVDLMIWGLENGGNYSSVLPKPSWSPKSLPCRIPDGFPGSSCPNKVWKCNEAMLRPAMGVQQVEGGVDKEMPSPNETVALVGTTTARRVMLMMYCILIAFRRVKRGICSSLLGAYPKSWPQTERECWPSSFLVSCCPAGLMCKRPKCVRVSTQARETVKSNHLLMNWGNPIDAPWKLILNGW